MNEGKRTVSCGDRSGEGIYCERRSRGYSQVEYYRLELGRINSLHRLGGLLDGRRGWE